MGKNCLTDIILPNLCSVDWNDPHGFIKNFDTIKS